MANDRVSWLLLGLVVGAFLVWFFTRKGSQSVYKIVRDEAGKPVVLVKVD